MKAQFFARLFLLYGFSASIACGAQATLALSETKLAERLGAMGCQVELVLSEGKVIVDYVYATGMIAGDHMRTEPLPEDLFPCLKGLGRLRKLRLDVKGGEIDQTRLKALAGLQSLRELELFGRDVNDQVMPYVYSITNLESLRLWDGPIGAHGLARLPELKALKRLEINSLKKLDRGCIDAIAKLQGLEELRIYGQLEEDAQFALKSLPKLHTVGIGGPNVSAMLAELKYVSTIRSIEIAQAEIDALAAGHLRAIRNLQVLKLQCCSVTPEALRILQSLKLRRIECVRIRAEVLGELAKGMAECDGDLEVSK